MIALLTLSVTSSAQAQDGSSDVPAVNQYVETVPTARGEVAPTSSDTGGDPVPRHVARAIESQGGAQSEQLQAIVTSPPAAPAAGASRPAAGRTPRAGGKKGGSGRSSGVTAQRRTGDRGGLGTADTGLAAATTKAVGGGGVLLLVAGMLLIVATFTVVAIPGRRRPERP